MGKNGPLVGSILSLLAAIFMFVLCVLFSRGGTNDAEALAFFAGSIGFGLFVIALVLFITSRRRKATDA